MAVSFKSIENKYYELFGLSDPNAKKMNTLSNVLSFAILVISCLGMTGVMGGSTVGWTLLGIGGATMLLQLHGGNLKKRKVDLLAWGLFSTTLMVVGSLGGTGILSPLQVGYGTLTVLVASCIFYGLFLRGIAAKKIYDSQINK